MDKMDVQRGNRNEYISPLLQKNAEEHNSKPNYWLEYLAAWSVTLLIISNGAHIAWSGATMSLFRDPNAPVQLTNQESSWIVALLEMGSVIGAILSAFMLDSVGRKATILFTTVPLIIGPMMYIFATQVYMMYIGRLLCGISVGLSRSVVSVYIGEISSPKIRGILGSMIFIQLSLGMFLALLVGPFVSIAASSMCLLVIPLICFVSFLFMPESPYFLIMKLRHDDAKAVLCRLRRNHDVEDEFFELKTAVMKEQREKRGLSDLFRVPSNRKALIIAVVIIISLKVSGVNAILSYCNTIFEQTGSTLPPTTNGIILTGVIFLSSWLCVFFIDSWGRRPMLIVSCFTTVIPLSLIGLYFYLQHINFENIQDYSLVPVVSMFVFELTTGLGIGPLAQICVGELFPTDVKAAATCFCRICHSVFGFCITKMYQGVVDDYGLHTAFWGFAVLTLCCGVFTVYFVPETKQLSLKEVQDQLKGNTVQ